jgi:TonB-dependent receptor
MANAWKFDDGDAVAGTDSSASWEGATVEKELKDRLETQEILSVLVGGENFINAWTLDYSYGYSESKETEPNALYTLFEGEDLDIGYSSIGSVPALIGEEAVFEAASYLGNEFTLVDGLAKDEASSVKLNVTRDLFTDAYNGDIKFGVHYRTRSKSYDVDELVYAAPDDFRLELLRAPPPRYGLGPFGPGISSGAARDFFFQNQDDLELEEDDTLVASVAGDYDMNEDVTAAYLMSSVDWGDWRVVYGVRYEDTDFDATGTRIVVDDVEGSGDPEPRPTAFAKDQDHWLPGINVRFERGDLVFRAAATQTLARPNFGELSPGGEVVFESDDGENVLEAELGNPLLDIVESTNLDAGLEWYPGGVSMVSGGVFYKRLKNFIFIADVADMIDLDEIVGDIPIDDAEVIQPINGETADVYGLELAAVQQYDNGFYISANGTWVKSDARYPGREQKGDLPATPELVLNGTVGWENDMFSLRLAATYRDDALVELDDIEDPEFDIYQDGHLQVDFSARWNITPAWQLAFTANNLTDEPYYNYFGSRPYNAQYEKYGTTYSLGLRWTPF